MSTNSKTKSTRPDDSATRLHAQMHRDHLQWASDTAEWQDDLVEWQKEIRHLLAGLKVLQKTLEEQVTALVKQSEAIGQLCQERTTHERALAAFEQGDTSEELVVDAAAHQAQAEKYQQLKLSHAGTKQWQRTLLSEWQRLHKAIFGMSGL